MGLGPVAGEGDIKMHCCVAAYISDYAFLGTALLPHQFKYKVNFMVSLDHSMWFHAHFELTTGCSMSARAPGLVSVVLWVSVSGVVGNLLYL